MDSQIPADGQAIGGSKSPKPGFGGPLRVILSAAVIFIFSQVIAAFLVGLFESLANPGKRALDLLNNSNSAQFFYILIAEGLAAWLVFWLVKRRGLNLAAIGLGRRPAWKDLKFAAGGALVFYGLIIAGTVLLSFFVPQSQLNKQQDLGFNNLISSTDHIMAFFSLVIIPPLGEEILMRGYLYSGLRKAWKFWPALLVTSLLFGLAHLDGGAGGSLVWAASFDTFMLSAVLVYLREYSGALYAGILIHATNNLVAYSVHFK